MSVLNLAACPICHARYSLARQVTKSEGRSYISYECVDCDSVLLWLGDDLWLEANRWAYQKVGREDRADLLQRPMAARELEALARRAAREALAQPPRMPTFVRRSEPQTPLPPLDTSVSEPLPDAGPASPPDDRPTALPDAKPVAPDAVRDEAPGEVAGPPARTTGPARRRSRGSPFLVISVVLVLVCLVCISTVMIVSSVLSNRAGQISQSPTGVTASLTWTPMPTELPSATASPLPTETPPPTVTEAPLLTEPPAPTVPSAVQFQGVTDYVAGTGAHYVVGQVLNTSSDNLRFVEVLASFYDEGGQLVGTGSTFVELGIVEAGDTAPFKLATLDPLPSLVSYTLRTDYLTTDQDPLRLELLNHQATVDDEGRYHVTGEVRNPYEFSLKFSEIVVTYHNAAREIVRVEVTFAALEILPPGQISPFEVILVDPPPELDHYAIQTESVRE